MKKNNQSDKIVAFLILGVSLVIAVVLLIFMFYLIMWGAIIGFVLWGIFTLKEKLFPSTVSPTVSSDFFKETCQAHGRVIDSEVEWEESIPDAKHKTVNTSKKAKSN